MQQYARNQDLEQALDVRQVELGFMDHHGLQPYPIPEVVQIRQEPEEGDIPYVRPQFCPEPQRASQQLEPRVNYTIGGGGDHHRSVFAQEGDDVSLNSFAPISDIKEKMPQIDFTPDPAAFLTEQQRNDLLREQLKEKMAEERSNQFITNMDLNQSMN